MASPSLPGGVSRAPAATASPSPPAHSEPLASTQMRELRELVAPLLASLDGGREEEAWAFSRTHGAALRGMCVGAKAALCRSLYLRSVRGGPSGTLAAPAATSARALALAAALVEATHGLELTALKLALDVTEAPSRGGSLHHDLLSFGRSVTATDAAAGARLMAHFRREAPVALAAWRASIGGGVEDWPVKVFSDFDDTLVPRLFDCSFPGSIAYPGVAAFLLELIGSGGSRGSDRRGENSESASVGAASISPSALYLRPAVDASASAAGACMGMGSIVRSRGDAGSERRQVNPSLPASVVLTASSRKKTDGARRRSWNGPLLMLPAAASSSPVRSHKNAFASPRSSLPGAVFRPSFSPLLTPATTETQITPRKPSSLPLSRPRSVSCSDAVHLFEPDVEAEYEPVTSNHSRASGLTTVAGASPHTSTPLRSLSPLVPPSLSSQLPLPPRLPPPTPQPSLSGLVFLSARPAMLKESTFEAAVSILGGAASPRAILCGTLLSAVTNSRIAAKKAENFAAYMALYPEFRVVWLGDSGQGDIAAGLHMLEQHAARRREAEAAAAAAIIAAAAAGARSGGMAADLAWLPPDPLILIHDICGSAQRPSIAPLARATWRARRVHVFDSFAEAAAVCYEAGLLSPAQVRAVVEAAAAGIGATRFANDRQRSARLDEFQRAVGRCRAALLSEA